MDCAVETIKRILGTSDVVALLAKQMQASSVIEREAIISQIEFSRGSMTTD